MSDVVGGDSVPFAVQEKGRVGYYKDADATIRHRLDGPAIIRKDGTTEWWFEGKKHRVDGPAKVLWNGSFVQWYLNGERHHLDEPAWVKYDEKLYYVDGEEVTLGQIEYFQSILLEQGIGKDISSIPLDALKEIFFNTTRN